MIPYKSAGFKKTGLLKRPRKGVASSGRFWVKPARPIPALSGEATSQGGGAEDVDGQKDTASSAKPWANPRLFYLANAPERSL